MNTPPDIADDQGEVMAIRHELRCKQCPDAHTFTIPGVGQLLLEVWADGTVTLSHRAKPDPSLSWGPPVTKDGPIL